MKVFLCIKSVPDTAANIRVAGENGYDESVKFVINPYDEYASEEAVKLVEQEGGEVVIVTIGKENALSTVRSALALGSHRAILVTTDRLFLDSVDTAAVLAKVIEEDGQGDLIFTGCQAVDSGGAQTSYHLGAALGLPVVSDVLKLSVDGETVVAEQEIGGGDRAVIEMSIPCVIAATKGLNEPRYPKLPDVMKAKKKEVKQIKLEDLGLSLSSQMEVMTLEQVPERSNAQILEGNVENAVGELVTILRDKEKILE